MICSMSNGTRLKIYRKIASLMRNRFSLMNALDMLHDGVSNGGKNPNEPMAIAIAHWARSLQNGLPFSDALKGWAPDRERLMLSVGDVSDLEGALLNLIRVTEGSTKMIRPIVGAVAYPSFLFMMAVLIVYGIGVYMVPPMVNAEQTILELRGDPISGIEIPSVTITGPVQTEFFDTMVQAQLDYQQNSKADPVWTKRS